MSRHFQDDFGISRDNGYDYDAGMSVNALDAPMNKENLMAPMSAEEYAQLCDIVGALAISQFNGNQKAYRQAIVDIFSVYAFGELDFRELTDKEGDK